MFVGKASFILLLLLENEAKYKKPQGQQASYSLIEVNFERG